MSSFKNAFSLLQKIGKCMMLPVSVLPVAGILLGVGSANFSWLPEAVSQIMAASGNAIFGNLPLLFAIGVAIGLTENDGVAALAGTVGYVVFLAAMGVCAKLQGIETETDHGHPVDRDRRLRRHHRRADCGRGLQSLLPDPAPELSRLLRRQTLGADHHRLRRHRRSAPCSASSGRRSAAASIASRTGRCTSGRRSPSRSTASSSARSFRSACTTSGTSRSSSRPATYTDPATGAVVHGEIARFIAGDPTAGNMTGGYLFKMWGLPAAASPCGAPRARNSARRSAAS